MRALILALAILAAGLHADPDNKNTQITAVSQTVLVAVDQRDTLTFSLAGTWSGTIVVEASPNSVAATATFSGISFTAQNATTYVGSATANGTYKANVGGYRYARLRASVFASGSMTTTVQVGQGAAPWPGVPGPGSSSSVPSYISVVPCSTVVYTGIAGSVTSPSSVQGSSMVYLTGNASVFENPSANTVTAKYFLSGTTFVAAADLLKALTLEPGARRTVADKALRYVHIYSPSGTGGVPLVVENCY